MNDAVAIGVSPDDLTQVIDGRGAGELVWNRIVLVFFICPKTDLSGRGRKAICPPSSCLPVRLTS